VGHQIACRYEVKVLCVQVREREEKRLGAEEKGGGGRKRGGGGGRGVRGQGRGEREESWKGGYLE